MLVNTEFVLVPKIVVIGNKKAEHLIRTSIDITSLPAKIIFEGGSFEDSLLIVEKYKGEADVFITGESIVNKLRKRISTPIVSVATDGSDIINAITLASNILGKNKKIYFVCFNAPLQVVTVFSKLTNIDIEQISYNSIFEIEEIIDKLIKKGVKQIVATSLVCLLAERNNIKCIVYYSAKTYKKAFTQAINIAIAQCQIKYLSEQYKTISNLTDIGVICCNLNGKITHINKKALTILKLEHSNIIGHNVQNLFNSKEIMDFDKVRDIGLYNKIDVVRGKKIIITTTPINIDDKISGLVFSFQETAEISNTEYIIRNKEVKKCFKAKYSFNMVKGNNELFIQNIKRAKAFASNDFTILIQGETGTGKELLAHAIHDASSRSNNNFVTINCAALPEALLESELFGYEPGAFTGGQKGGKRGIVELAHGGTLFMDEIGELPVLFQSKILRFIEEKEIIKIGGTKLVPVDVRIIAATNRDLREEVKKGNFKLDLYQRLSVLKLTTIPLRDRSDDVDLLFRYFFKKIKNGNEIINESVIEHIVDKLKDYSWPGNIRELKSLVINFVVISKDTEITYDIADKILDDFIIYDKDNNVLNESLSKVNILNILKETQFNRTETAKRLGISRTTLWRKMQTF
ncbi:MAG: sigma 54-interacting transcriptional regulator [Spirochaetales bacterium]|nr:sigma 54-interacting transcriptional regulator [Spirochaetales bacterium]